MVELWHLGRYVTASVPTLNVVRSNSPTCIPQVPKKRYDENAYNGLCYIVTR